MKPHNTFDRACQRDAHWYADKHYREETVVKCILIDATSMPFIQRQAYAERVHYYYLLEEKGKTTLSGPTYCDSDAEVVCRLYDTDVITGSRACELLGGIKMQEFRELYTKWQESI